MLAPTQVKVLLTRAVGALTRVSLRVVVVVRVVFEATNLGAGVGGALFDKGKVQQIEYIQYVM